MRYERIGWVFLAGALVLGEAGVAQGGMVLQQNFSGSPHTFEGLLERRASAPRRFDQQQPRLGRILARGEGLRQLEALGIDPVGLFPDNRRFQAMHERRNLNPLRFDTFHPIFGVLLGEDLRLKNWTPPHLEVSGPPGLTLFPTTPDVPITGTGLPTDPPPSSPPTNAPPFSPPTNAPPLSPPIDPSVFPTPTAPDEPPPLLIDESILPPPVPTIPHPTYPPGRSPIGPWTPFTPPNGPPTLNNPTTPIVTNPVPVPEPATGGMMILGGVLGGIVAWMRRGKVKAQREAGHRATRNPLLG